MSLFRNALLTVCAGIFLLSITSVPNAQFYMFDDTDYLKPVYKWAMMQYWNSNLSKWDDTSMVIINNPDNPGEQFSKVKDEDGNWRISEKNLTTYENDRIKTTSSYLFDTITREYESEPYSTINVTYQDNTPLKIVSTTSLTSFFTFMDIPEEELTAMSGITLNMEANFEITNDKIIKDSSRIKPEGVTPQTSALVAPYLQMLNITNVNGWTKTTKDEYSYADNNKIIISSEWNEDANEWVFSSKDSIIFNNGKISVDYTSSYDSYIDGYITSKAVYSYNEENIEQILSMNYENEEWVNDYRVVYVYTPYNSSDIKIAKLPTSESKKSPVTFTTNHGYPALSLDFDKALPVSVECNFT